MTSPQFSHGLPVVDADDADTWPAALRDLVGRLAEQAHLDDVDDYVDLPLDAYDDQTHRLLEGTLVRGRHCTRLLDYEADAIRSQGLRLLNLDLLTDRLYQAHERGHLTGPEHAALRSLNCLTPDPHEYGERDNRVCLLLSQSPMTHDVGGLRLLLSYWGGEAIYWLHCESQENPDLGRKLRSLGRPALVTAHLDLSRLQPHRVYRSLVHLFVGTALGSSQAAAEVHFRSAVPAERIESIAFPGDPEYDRFPRLPCS